MFLYAIISKSPICNYSFLGEVHKIVGRRSWLFFFSAKQKKKEQPEPVQPEPVQPEHFISFIFISFKKTKNKKQKTKNKK